METIDHKSLGYILLNKKDSYNLTIYDKAFIFGCIEPDINFYNNGLLQLFLIIKLLNKNISL